MPQCRVLLADDDPQIRAFLQAALRARQYLVDLASDGVEAIDIVERLGGTVNLLITAPNGWRVPGAGCRANPTKVAGAVHLGLGRPARRTGMAETAICIPSKAFSAEGARQLHRGTARTVVGGFRGST
jgi:DNA-binding NarL/FixJ family response regulator